MFRWQKGSQVLHWHHQSQLAAAASWLRSAGKAAGTLACGFYGRSCLPIKVLAKRVVKAKPAEQILQPEYAQAHACGGGGRGRAGGSRLAEVWLPCCTVELWSPQ